MSRRINIKDALRSDKRSTLIHQTPTPMGIPHTIPNASLDLVLTLQPHVAQAVERALRNSTDSVVIETHQELSRLMHFRGLPTLPV